LRAYYPRFSYTRYLPALYREEDNKQQDNSKPYVLERYLANLEGFYTTLEDKMANVQVLFDPRTAPPETLEWLGRWLGVVLAPTWSKDKRRLFLRYAPLFFRYRGTLRGLMMALRLTLEDDKDCKDGADEGIFTNPDLESDEAWGVRLIEHFRTRLPPSSEDGPLVLTSVETQLWQDFLAGRYSDIDALNTAYGASFTKFSEVSVPTSTPAEGPRLSDWRQFRHNLTQLWRDFLARRYQEIKHFNAAYGSNLEDFSEVEAPTTTPAYDPQRSDWQTFRHYLLPLSRTAHRFSVLLPVKAGKAGGDAAQQNRLELARHIVELEKPAHTVFDLKFFWALFRVGEARLGQDTRLDQGSSRVPELMKPAVLGQGYLAESYLAESYLAYGSAPGRRVLNQDVLE
jgi:phage tail-like protein